MLKKLSVRLKSGTLTEFDSDTTLGIFCWRLKDYLGEEKLKSFIDFYRNNKPVFTISNALFEINGILFFPQPVYVPSQEICSQNKKENISSMLKNKENKSINFISLKRFNAFLNGNIEDYLISDEPIYENENKKVILTPGFESELRVSVEIDRQSAKSKEGQLFSYHLRYLKKGNTLVFLIKVIDEKAFNEFKCQEILKDVFTVGYGKKKSSGYGQCVVNGNLDDFKDIDEPDNPNGFITLGNYLPAQGDGVVDGYYDTKVKYGKLGESFSSSKVPFKKPIIMITQGSYFITSKPNLWYGRITGVGEISPLKSEAVQFGMPFTLLFNYSG